MVSRGGLRPPSRRAALWAAILCAMLLQLSCGDGLPLEFPCPEFRLKSPISKKYTTNADITGKPVVIYWFASW